MRRRLQLSLLFLSGVVCLIIVHNREVSPRKWGPSSDDPVIPMPQRFKQQKNDRRERRPFHVAMTAEDTTYSQWQSRIMYYWYMKKKSLPGSEMGRFTRILHSGSPDGLMDEIPTYIVDPLPKGVDQGYIVLNRPWAFVQWLANATIEEEYVLMAEPDHIFLTPMPNLVHEQYPVAFKFFYIKPLKHEKIIRKYFPKKMGPVTNVDPIGNSPVMIRKDLLEKIAPTWMNVSLKMKYDNETDNAFGWVLEMYAYAVASALHGVQHILLKDFMLQPPWDPRTRNKEILHYTYSCDFTIKGKVLHGERGEWSFDKRAYLNFPPPRNLSLPPRGAPQSVVALIKLINEATANLPNWDAFRGEDIPQS